jgi:uncharacterized protein (TIGR03437 family)
VVGVSNNGQIAGFPIQIAPAAPGILADANNNLVPNSSVSAGGTPTLYLTGDGDIASGMPTGFAPTIGTSVTSLPKSRQPLSVTVGGVPTFVQFYGIPVGLVGVTQLNFTVPASVPPGVQPVVVTVGGVASPPVNVTVKALSGGA